MAIWNIIKAIILGIVQGITEWLPISSTGHLILFERFLTFENVSPDFFGVFKIVIQLGSILAVVVLYFKKLFPYKKPDELEYSDKFGANVGIFFKSVFNDKKTWLLWLKIAIACIPAVIVGFFLDDILDEYLSTKYIIAATLIIYGLAFLWLENRAHKVKCNDIEKLDVKTSFLIGCFQTLALIPGTSRSGSTIIGATVLGTSRPVAAEFSFFLAVPIMFGATFLRIIKSTGGFTAFEWILMLIGTAVAYFVSVVAIKFFINYIKKHSFVVFGWYRIILGIVILLVSFLTRLF